MARTYLTFGDIEGELEVLRVECSRCQRKGFQTAKPVANRIPECVVGTRPHAKRPRPAPRGSNSIAAVQHRPEPARNRGAARSRRRAMYRWLGRR